MLPGQARLALQHVTILLLFSAHAVDDVLVHDLHAFRVRFGFRLRRLVRRAYAGSGLFQKVSRSLRARGLRKRNERIGQSAQTSAFSLEVGERGPIRIFFFLQKCMKSKLSSC